MQIKTGKGQNRDKALFFVAVETRLLILKNSIWALLLAQWYIRIMYVLSLAYLIT